eukprot:COSAG06_NODE_1251_length_10106_cov_8.031678_2_plen_251_part_00
MKHTRQKAPQRKESQEPSQGEEKGQESEEEQARCRCGGRRRGQQRQRQQQQQPELRRRPGRGLLGPQIAAGGASRWRVRSTLSPGARHQRPPTIDAVFDRLLGTDSRALLAHPSRCIPWWQPLNMCHASGDIGNVTVGMGTFPPCQPPNCPTANRAGAVGQWARTLRQSTFDGGGSCAAPGDRMVVSCGYSRSAAHADRTQARAVWHSLTKAMQALRPSHVRSVTQVKSKCVGSACATSTYMHALNHVYT